MLNAVQQSVDADQALAAKIAAAFQGCNMREDGSPTSDRKALAAPHRDVSPHCDASSAASDRLPRETQETIFAQGIRSGTAGSTTHAVLENALTNQQSASQEAAGAFSHHAKCSFNGVSNDAPTAISPNATLTHILGRTGAPLFGRIGANHCPAEVWKVVLRAGQSQEANWTDATSGWRLQPPLCSSNASQIDFIAISPARVTVASLEFHCNRC